MDTKLTLKLDNQVIENAKLYARRKNTSLSRLIESYLQFLTSNNKNKEEETTPLVKSLSGILNATKSLDYKGSYKMHLSKKYSK